MKKWITFLLNVSLFMFGTNVLFAQLQTNMYYRGEMNAWGATAMTYRALGTPNWIVTILSDGDDSESEFKFANTTDWSDKDWSRGDVITLNSLTTFYQPNGGNGKFNETNTYYYTFTIKDVSSGNSTGYVMETSAVPVTIDAVSQLPLAANVSDNDDVIVTITTNATPCTEEHVFVRYSTDNWATSSVVEASFTGTTGTATIPAQSAETNVSYYIFSTTVSSPSSDYDLMTINYNNNGGSNYSYTVKYGTTADGTWNNTSTWRSGTVPASNNDVVINHAVTVTNSVSSPAECTDLIINSGTLTINVNCGLTVYGDFTNNGIAGNILIKSDNTGNGSLIIEGTVSGDVTVKRYIAAFSSNNDGWHEIGCPVTSFSVANTDWDPTYTGTNNDLYYYDESTDTWMNYRTSTFDFTPQKGYLVANDADITHSFTGTLNNSDISFSNLSYNSSKGNGWHLLGNPFPCAIKWNDGNWSLNNVVGTAKIWDYASNPGNYSDLSANGIIPSTNGFFVQVNSATNSFTIPTASRTHNTTNNYKDFKETKNLLQIKITNNKNVYTDICKVGFKADATYDMDIKYDSHKLFGLSEAPQLWTMSKDELYSTNYLPFDEKEIDVPLNFKAGIDASYVFTVTGQETFNTSGDIYLEDTFTGTIINLKQQSDYKFTALQNDETNRFVLHFYNVTATPEIQSDNSTLIYAYNNSVILKSNKNTLNGTIEMVNLLGQIVYKKSVSGTKFISIRPSLHNGIYIARYKSNNGFVQSEKIILK